MERLASTDALRSTLYVPPSALQALSISRPVARALDAGRSITQFHVLAVFDRVCDLVTASSDVVALVTPEVGNGSLNVVVDALPGVWTGIEIGQHVEIDSDSIHLGHIAIDLRGATVWEPCPDWARLAACPDTLAANIPHLAAWLIHNQSLPPGGLAALLSPQLPSMRPKETLLLSTARQAAEALLAAIASGDLARAGEAAAKLAGLGSGLTPAGDDFLIGVIAWLWLNLQSPISNTIAKAASNKTTTLSSALLRAAGRGEFAIAWHNLLDALAGGNPAQIERAAQQALAYGHTSGADALTGLVMAAQR